MVTLLQGITSMVVYLNEINLATPIQVLSRPFMDLQLYDHDPICLVCMVLCMANVQTNAIRR